MAKVAVAVWLGFVLGLLTVWDVQLCPTGHWVPLSAPAYQCDLKQGREQ